MQKTLMLIACSAMVALGFLGPVATLHGGCAWWERLAYPLFHGNVIHAAMNAWCLLGITWHMRPRWHEWLLAYAVAVSWPWAGTPVTGASGVCFALVGVLFWRCRKSRLLACVLPALAIGFVVPGVAGWVHAYAFVCGILIRYLL